MPKPRIRNAYQKIGIGDVLAYHDDAGRQTATVTGKGTHGLLEATRADGRQTRIFGCDIDGILRRPEQTNETAGRLPCHELPHVANLTQ
jgi:hypothetical protein